MGKKILDSKLLYVVLSVILTVGLWCYVTSTDGTPQQMPYRNVPVEFRGMDILRDRGLMVVNEAVTVNLTIQAKPAVHAKLANSEELSVTVDVSGIGEEGSHSLAYTPNLPAGVSSSDVSYVTSNARLGVVTLEVARYLSRAVTIKGSFQGSVEQGYLAGNENDFRFSPETIVVSGRAEEVNQVAYARVTVTGENHTKNIYDSFPFQLIGANDEPLENLNVTCDVDTVYASFPIRAMAEIPLEVKLTAGGGLDVDDVRVELTTNTITVAGSKEAVDALVSQGAITLAEINLATIKDKDERTFAIPLTDELENLSGVAEVTATFRVTKRVVTQTFVTRNIQVINEPEGWNVDIVTKELAVEIRGTKALVDELIAENIRVVADLQNIDPAAGPYTVPAIIYPDSVGTKGDLGELPPANASYYSVVVSLTRAEQGG